jgi:FKBP-type peptidyl-prolyl cis-trans isomerase (trigger factor)
MHHLLTCASVVNLCTIHDCRRGDIEALVRATMGIEAIFAAEGLEVDPARLNAEIEQVAAEYKAAGDDVDMEQLRRQAEEAAKVRPHLFCWTGPL